MVIVENISERVQKISPLPQSVRYSLLVRIAYCTNVRLPSERAHGHQVAQVCEALTRLGHTVKIFAPIRVSTVTQDFATYYGRNPAIQVRYIKNFDAPFFALRFFPLGVLGLWLSNITLRKHMSAELHDEKFDVMYTRSPALVTTLVSTHGPVILELHQLPRFFRGRFVRRCNQCRLVVCLTSVMRNTLKHWGVAEEKLVVEPDGVDLERFRSVPDKESAHTSLGVKTQRYVVGYVGRLKTLGMEKGVADLLRALSTLRASKKIFGLIVGGPATDVAAYKQLAQSLRLTDDDILFTGELPASQVPQALAACDAVAMPFPNLPHYRTHMSPLKMFEYMAIGKPIVTSDLPPIRDVLSEDCARFFKSGDSNALAKEIEWVATHPREAHILAERAKMLAGRYDWKERMQRILSAAIGG